MPEYHEVSAQATRDLAAARKDQVKRGRPSTKAKVVEARLAQGQVLPPVAMRRDRLRSRTIGQCRESMTSVTNACARGELDVDVGEKLIKMLRAVVQTLKDEREDELVRASLERLDGAVRRLEAAGAGDLLDLSAIRASLMDPGNGN